MSEEHMREKGAPERGYLHVYTGNGKGKTTAALGLALRAAGAGMRVFFAQFIKGMKYSEIRALERLDDCISVRQYGRGCFIDGAPAPEDIDAAKAGIDEIRLACTRESFDLVILDEAAIACHFKLFSAAELIDVIRSIPPRSEIVVTGRYAPDELTQTADLVTEMKEIKHYFTGGVQARKGIEC